MNPLSSYPTTPVPIEKEWWDDQDELNAFSISEEGLNIDEEGELVFVSQSASSASAAQQSSRLEDSFFAVAPPSPIKADSLARLLYRRKEIESSFNEEESEETSLAGTPSHRKNISEEALREKALLSSFSSSQSLSALAPQEQISSTNLIERRSLNELPMTLELRKDIHYLVEQLATSSFLLLTTNSQKLSTLGNKLRKEVHPYRFMLEILHSSPLSEDKPLPKEHFKKILSRKFILKNFTVNLGRNIKQGTHPTDPYRHDFAAALGLDPDIIKQHEDTENWHELAFYLSQSK